MRSEDAGQVASDLPIARGQANPLHQQQVRVKASTSTVPPERWEDEDFEYVDTDGERIFDPWNDNSPDQLYASGKTDRTKSQEVPALNPPSVDEPTSQADETTVRSIDESGMELSPDFTPEPYLPLFPGFTEQPETSEIGDVQAGATSVEEFEFPPITDVEQWIEECEFFPEGLEAGFTYHENSDADVSMEHFDSTGDVEFEYFDYDADARQEVWDDDLEENADSLHLVAQQKAAEVVSRLNFNSPRERSTTLPWLTELFRRRDHHATYHAILGAADSGVSCETLRNMAALRDIWENRQEWWLGRYGWAGNFRELSNGRTALTWKLARSICEARSDFSPEYMIDDEWMREWLYQHPSNEFRNFPQFIGMKVMTLDKTFQDTPRWSDLRQRISNEFGETVPD